MTGEHPPKSGDRGDTYLPVSDLLDAVEDQCSDDEAAEHLLRRAVRLVDDGRAAYHIRQAHSIERNGDGGGVSK